MPVMPLYKLGKPMRYFLSELNDLSNVSTLMCLSSNIALSNALSGIGTNLDAVRSAFGRKENGFIST